MMRCIFLALPVYALFVAHPSANAGLFLIDFCATTDQARCLGSAADWDAFTDAAPGEVFPLTDWSMDGDDDVIMTLVPNDDEGLLNMWPNFTAPPDEGSTFNDIDVPFEALADYWYRNPDSAGTSALLQFDDIDPGSYDVTVFEGRITDSFQEGIIWVGDEDGSGEPDEANTGNFAQSEFQTVSVTIRAGDSLFYRHLEDGTGGISGMIIQSAGPLASPGDYNADGMIDVVDIDLQAAAMKDPMPDLTVFDENSDGVVDRLDRRIHVEQRVGTWFGDANLDGEFNSGDLVSVFTAGKYETGDLASWTDGDWDGNMDFGSGDLVVAFTDGGYEQGPRPEAVGVPEPSSTNYALIALLGLVVLRQMPSFSPMVFPWKLRGKRLSGTLAARTQ